MSDYISKPVQPKLLLSKLARLEESLSPSSGGSVPAQIKTLDTPLRSA